jgi:hypothetical protein
MISCNMHFSLKKYNNHWMQSTWPSVAAGKWSTGDMPTLLLLGVPYLKMSLVLWSRHNLVISLLHPPESVFTSFHMMVLTNLSQPQWVAVTMTSFHGCGGIWSSWRKITMFNCRFCLIQLHLGCCCCNCPKYFLHFSLCLLQYNCYKQINKMHTLECFNLQNFYMFWAQKRKEFCKLKCCRSNLWQY